MMKTNRFIMNYIPEHRLKTNDGKRDGIFWNFDGNRILASQYAFLPQSPK
jgi:hypothetical protein